MSELTTLLSSLGTVAKGVLGGVAPTILKTAGGPFGVLAGAALQAIFGTSDPTQLDAALANATPDQIIALKKAEGDLQVQLKQLGIAEEKLSFDDTTSARAMQIATKDPTAGRLAWLVIAGFLAVTIGVIAGLFVWPDRAKLLLEGSAGLFFGSVFGYLSNEAKQAAAFYFGSSAGSQAKDATLAEIAKS